MAALAASRSLVARLTTTHGPLKLLFFGPPGVGKGTYATLLSKAWALPHISTGDMIRAEIKSASDLGKQFNEYSKSGKLVPDELVCAVAQKRLSRPDTKNGYILDGFPRTLVQAAGLESVSPSSLCLNFILPQKYLVMKVAGRRICDKCGKVFNVADINEAPYRMPPLLPLPDGRCTSCGSTAISQRADDTKEVVLNRLEIHHKDTAPLIEFYIRKGVLRTYEVQKGVEDFPAIEKLAANALDEMLALRRKK